MVREHNVESLRACNLVLSQVEIHFISVEVGIVGLGQKLQFIETKQNQQLTLQLA